LIASACTHAVRPEPPVVKRDASLEQLLALYDLGYRKLSSVKGLARVEVAAPSVGKQSFQAAIYLARPEEIRIEGFDLFGGPLFDLVSRGGETRLFVAGKEKREGLERLIGESGPLRPGFADLLGIPQPHPPGIPVLEKEEDQFNLMILRPRPGLPPRLEKKFVIERAEFRVIRALYYAPSGFPESTLSFSDYRRVNTFWLPFKVEGESAHGKVRLSFSELIANPGREEARRDADPGD
jgi:hypothetical protein